VTGGVEPEATVKRMPAEPGGPNDGAPIDPSTPAMTGAVAMHELFMNYQRAGFSQWQALYLCGQLIRRDYG